MALSGYFVQYPVSQFGLYCEWSGTPNKRTNSTRVTVDVYLRYFDIAVGELSGSVQIGGESQGFTTAPILDDTASEWHNRHIFTFTTNVQHDNDGTKNGLILNASLAFNGEYLEENIGDIVASTAVDLDAIVTYKLQVITGANTNVIIRRTYSPVGATGELEDSADLYDGDRLRITFLADDDYQIVVHTVNGFKCMSGNTIVVDRDIVVASTAQEIVRQQFTLEDMWCFDSKGSPIKALYQWDKNVSIVIKNIRVSPLPVFQFANRLSRETISVQPILTGDDLVVEIPNTLLERPEAIIAYVVSVSGDETTTTLGSVYIPVRARKQPNYN